jgi:redox-regulated HSP33 family molecular chaperone
MKRVTLLFPNTKSLWAFAQTLSTNNVHVNSTALTLNCDCSEDDVSKALMQFDAKIIEEVEERRRKN